MRPSRRRQIHVVLRGSNRRRRFRPAQHPCMRAENPSRHAAFLVRLQTKLSTRSAPALRRLERAQNSTRTAALRRTRTTFAFSIERWWGRAGGVAFHSVIPRPPHGVSQPRNHCLAEQCHTRNDRQYGQHPRPRKQSDCQSVPWRRRDEKPLPAFRRPPEQGLRQRNQEERKGKRINKGPRDPHQHWDRPLPNRPHLTDMQHHHRPPRKEHPHRRERERYPQEDGQPEIKSSTDEDSLLHSSLLASPLTPRPSLSAPITAS